MSKETWRKSTYTYANGNCVEVAFLDGVSVRDSKQPDAGRLSFPPSSWASFLNPRPRKRP